jgi:hypothetical protein
MCRQVVPDAYFEAPELLEAISSEEVPLYDDGYQWFYEGRDGWWIYDKRASDDIEAAFKSGLPKCDLLIAGHIYVIDFVKSLQYRRDEPHRQRQIKRDLPNGNVTKGIAGLRQYISGLSVDESEPAPPPSVRPATLGADCDVPGNQPLPDPVSSHTRSRDERLRSQSNSTVRSADGRRETYL